ncbi:E3 ubiquitin protein ligase RIN2 [Striga hermonthica]|uniref:RING-type E3 ubiquitin transferase n=1 Tax=Striga hermonthica TaxID=68872 RepID=A0A9N7MQM6_STRHE|nr:E3 ubiquitin protein ligase RIN2 [Striga hermonthica]
MGVNTLFISVACTALSLVGLQYWTDVSLEKHKSSGLVVDEFLNLEDVSHALELLLGSYTTLVLVACFATNVAVLTILGLKTIFFSELYTSEIRKMLERLINYIIYKGTFLPLVVPPTIFQAGLWSTWLAVLCFLKMFQALARDRLERLNVSPSATPWTYFRVYSALLFVLSGDLLWILLCLIIYNETSSPMFLLLFFEPSSIAFETLQAIVVHGFQLLEIWFHHSAGDSESCRLSKILDISPAGFLGEWKGILIRNLGFFLDMMTMLMAIAHYLHIWFLHGMAFHLVDAVLFLNIRAILSAIVRRAKGFIKLRGALGTLHGALPDATSEELRVYDDECAICREPMAKAKKLSCKHLFHLACLRSWLDQGLAESYSCPTCRKPLFAGRPENGASTRAAEIPRDEQLARSLSTGLDRPNLPGHNPHPGVFPSQSQNPERVSGIDSSWLSLDGAGPSRLSRVQMVVRQLAAVGETYDQTVLEDAAWSLFPPDPSQAGTSRSAATPAASPLHYPRGAAGLHVRSTSQTVNGSLANIMAMAETVREVLPHIPDDLIFQDLQRTNSVAVTVNNLLQISISLGDEGSCFSKLLFSTLVMEIKSRRSSTKPSRRISGGRQETMAVPMDRISALPDDVICHILSFLSTRRCVQTSILARRWRSLWAHSPILDFDFTGELLDYWNNMVEIINTVMFLHKGQNISTFRLANEDICGLSQDEIDAWIVTLISSLISCNVRNLYIWLDVKMPLCLFSCGTLVDLSLSCCCCDFPLTTTVYLPSLKRLQLDSVEFECDECFTRLVSGCRVLEELSLLSDTVLSCFVSSPSLIRLKLSTDCDIDSETVLRVKIDTPALRFLELRDIRSEEISAEGFASLVEANIYMNLVEPIEDVVSYSHSVMGLVNKLCNVTCLNLSTRTMEVPDSAFRALVVKFPNLTKLDFSADVRFIPFLLENADNLETITFGSLYGDQERWIEPKKVAPCLVSHLRTVRVTYFSFTALQFKMVRYIIRNAKVLRRMEIQTRHCTLKEKHEAIKKISLSERGSEACQVVIL